MPSCLVNGCLSKSGRKGQSPNVILHKFPKDPIRIRNWLLNTGQQFENLDLLVEMIYEGQKQNKYWFCSLHFTHDSYIINQNGRVLRQVAVPSIFETVPEGQCVIQESLKKTRRRSKKMPAIHTPEPPMPTVHTMPTMHTMPPMEIGTYGTYIVNIKEEPAWQMADIEYCKPGFSNTATQTEFTLCNSQIQFFSVEENRNWIKTEPEDEGY